MSYLYAAIAAIVMLAAWGKWGGDGTIENTAMLAVFIGVEWWIFSRPKS